eukprot:snap_masked-scaffold459_size165548-processed-gene-0.8 protein:Tk05710 transcript:snap_masked-scaffold459_size165548-processed-gene-0.8-mRNA-1 annotation:"hypothetical protein DAPPUDRAFT_41601"
MSLAIKCCNSPITSTRKLIFSLKEVKFLFKLSLVLGCLVFILTLQSPNSIDWPIRPATKNAKVLNDDYEVNHFGDNDNLRVLTNRQRNETRLKTILMWNDAYGVREYDIGHGREPFYRFKCPETRCWATNNRSYLADVKDFDALLIHQRAITWDDMPKSRSPQQRYVHWLAESPQYRYMDENLLNNYFNWTMTYRRDSDFYLPYGRFHQVKPHPEGEELKLYIKQFGEENRHLAGNRTQFQAAWFVSHCATQARRERYAKAMKDFMSVHIYGRCGRYTCERNQERQCYEEMEANYRFYLSFENSICNDYVTEKFFNIFHYDVIPVAYGAHKFSEVAPPHSYVNVFNYKSPRVLVEHLEELQTDDAKYAQYFWWRDFYEMRNTLDDRAQAYCDLCKRLNDPLEPPKVYEDMHKWWVEDSHCKKLRSSFYKDE